MSLWPVKLLHYAITGQRKGWTSNLNGCLLVSRRTYPRNETFIHQQASIYQLQYPRVTFHGGSARRDFPVYAGGRFARSTCPYSPVRIIATCN